MTAHSSPFRVDVETVADGVQVYLLRDERAWSSARVVPGLGNNLISFQVGLAGRSQALETIYFPSTGDGVKKTAVFAGNPILFPYPNRVRDGQYTFEGTTRDLRSLGRNGYVIHGFVFDAPWQVAEASTDGGARLVSTLRWEDMPSVQEPYPFPFLLTVAYTLVGATLRMQAWVLNTGRRRLPMGFGIHPYFRLPLAEGGRRQDCLVRVPARKQWELDANLLPTGRVVPVPPDRDYRRPHRLGEQTLDDVYTDLEREASWSECQLMDPAAAVRLKVRADEAFREWVVYAPPDQPTICFEPYTAPTDAINLQNRGIDAGLVVLEPREEWTGIVEFIVEPV